MARRSLIEAVFAIVIAAAGLQARAQDVLPPEQAFPYTVEADGSRLVVKFAVLDGYYLYRERFGFESATPGVELAPAVFPVGEIHSDEFFGEQETYRRKFEIVFPYRRTAAVDDSGARDPLARLRRHRPLLSAAGLDELSSPAARRPRECLAADHAAVWHRGRRLTSFRSSRRS